MRQRAHEPSDHLPVLGLPRRRVGAHALVDAVDPLAATPRWRSMASTAQIATNTAGSIAEVGGDVVAEPRCSAPARRRSARRAASGNSARSAAACSPVGAMPRALPFGGDVAEPVVGVRRHQVAPDAVAHLALLVGQIERRHRLLRRLGAGLAGARHQRVVQGIGRGATEIADRAGAAGERQETMAVRTASARRKTPQRSSHVCAWRRARRWAWSA